MIPIADNLPACRQPLVNYFLLALNIAIFLGELRLELTGRLGDTIGRFGLVPFKLTAIASDAIAQNNPAAFVALFLSLGTAITGMFLHGSFSQILGNSLFLWIFGKRVEATLGRWRYLLFYLFSGIIVGIFQVIIDPKLTVPLIGANGAVAAILGFYLTKFAAAKIDSILPLVIIFVPVELPAIFYLFWWLVQQIFYGFGSLNIGSDFNQFSINYLLSQGLAIAIGASGARFLKQRDQ